MYHGATALTRTPWGAHSQARLRVSWFIAALDIAYRAPCTKPRSNLLSLFLHLFTLFPRSRTLRPWIGRTLAIVVARCGNTLVSLSLSLSNCEACASAAMLCIDWDTPRFHSFPFGHLDNLVHSSLTPSNTCKTWWQWRLVFVSLVITETKPCLKHRQRL